MSRWWPRGETPAADVVLAWIQAGLLALLPWLEPWRPAWVPLIVATACVPSWPWQRQRYVDPWATAGVLVSAVVWWAVQGGLLTAVGWSFLTALVITVTWVYPRGVAGSGPLLGLTVGLLGWGGALAVRPELLAFEQGGWIASLLAVVMAGRLVPDRSLPADRDLEHVLGPPRREVEGRLALDRVVLADGAGLTLSTEWDLRLAAGESLALLCGDGAIREALVSTLAGRRAPASGRVVIDGVAVEASDRVVGVVAPGEPFCVGSITANLGVLTGRQLAAGEVRAAVDSCGLERVVEVLGEAGLEADGEPLDSAGRLAVLLGRVLLSHLRIVVVADPRPWVDDATAEQWRRAVVRASVGRTAIWLTTDRGLASRADRRGIVHGGRLIVDGE